MSPIGKLCFYVGNYKDIRNWHKTAMIVPHDFFEHPSDLVYKARSVVDSNSWFWLDGCLRRSIYGFKIIKETEYFIEWAYDHEEIPGFVWPAEE